ncbi:MAG: hypothetical protein C5B51_21850 [Terriglobia bacterium]|nr:MAG: hypothetical protein C5B51_21850 [Terriglobia bacterium]
MRLIALLWCAAAACAQSDGTLTGMVVDLSGDPVANAPVQATHASTHAVYKTVSSQRGEYTVAQLPPGDYEVSVAALGYNAFTARNVNVAAGKSQRFDIHLIDFQFGTLGETASNFASTRSALIPRPLDQRRALGKVSPIFPESGMPKGP